MNIGIIGAGNLGTGLAKQLVKKGHVVTLSFSREVAKQARKVIAGLVKDIGGAPVDAGPLNLARYAEPSAMLHRVAGAGTPVHALVHTR